jgi:diaminohydroxyphosphoribosylaminopyrimidine deaminase/5-amino-6-(5-phosphoribosylamino)uracil reductase
MPAWTWELLPNALRSTVWGDPVGRFTTLAGSFLAARLIDLVVAYIAPVLIGGGSKPALAGPGAPNIADAKRFQLEDVVRIGPDVRVTATPLS